MNKHADNTEDRNKENNNQYGISIKRNHIIALYMAVSADPTIEQVKVSIASDGKIRATVIQTVQVEKQLRLTKLPAAK